MIALGLLLIVTVLVILLVYATSRSRESLGAPTSDSSVNARVIRNPDIERWVKAGLLTDDQASAIEQFETQRRTPAVPPRISPAIEALAYVGGTLLAVGAGMLVSRFWDDMGTAGHLSVIGFTAAGTGAIGAIVGESEPVETRLRSFLWALSSLAIGAFSGLFIFDVLDKTGEPVAFSVAASTALTSGAFWMLRDRPLQHVLTFFALVVSVGVGIAWMMPTNPFAWIGLTFWLIGALWAVAAWKRLLPPEIVGFTLGALLTLVGAGITGNRFDWLAPLLGLATAVAWTTIGINVNEVLALAPGVAGIFIYLPWTLGRFFGESLGAPIIIMLSGALLLAIVAVLWQRRSKGAQIGDLWGGHFTGVTRQ